MSISRSLTALCCAVLAGACARTAVVHGPAEPHRAAYVVQLGNDTIAVEQFTRGAGRVAGELLVRAQSPQQTTALYNYVATVAPDGRVTRLEVTARRPDGTVLPGAPRSNTLYFSVDTVRRELMSDTLVVQRVAARDAMPQLGTSVALTELALARVRASGRDSADIVLLNVAAPRATAWPMRLMGTDSARIYYFGAAQRLRLNEQGHVISLSGAATTNKMEIRAVPSVDIPGIAARWAGLESAGVWIGTTRDTVRARVGAASIWIDYGRPMARGRAVFTHAGVLGDTLWRTGANAATQLRTDRELVIGGSTIPAGTYSLFTHAKGGVYHLIVNRQTGQWGTEYRPAQDVARIPLTAAQLPDVVERFTIAVEPREGAAGTLALLWGTTRLSTPFTVR